MIIVKILKISHSKLYRLIQTYCSLSMLAHFIFLSTEPEPAFLSAAFMSLCQTI